MLASSLREQRPRRPLTAVAKPRLLAWTAANSHRPAYLAGTLAAADGLRIKPRKKVDGGAPGVSVIAALDGSRSLSLPLGSGRPFSLPGLCLGEFLLLYFVHGVLPLRLTAGRLVVIGVYIALLSHKTLSRAAESRTVSQ